MRGVLRTILRGVVAASLAVVPAAASAAPPEGCVGFPDIPEAWLCITSWTPQNVAPRAGTAGGTTFLVPQFCAFSECVGPTPVTVPGVYAGQGGGAIATITYRGDTYTVPVAVAPVLRFYAALSVDCYGCGPTMFRVNGTFTGVLDGHSFAGSTMTGSIAGNVPAVTCVNPAGYAPGSMTGTTTVTDATRSASFTFALTMVGASATLSFPNRVGVAQGAVMLLSPNPCNTTNVKMFIDVTGALAL